MSFRNWLRPAGIIVMIAGLIVHIVGIATPNWLVCEYNNKTCYFDLWNKTVCYDKKIKSVDPYEGEYPELTAVKSLAVTGLGTCLMAIASAIFCSTVDEDRLKKIGSGAISLASSAVEISGGIFGFGVKDGDYGDPEDKTPEKAKIEDGFRLGYSFYLCVVAGFVVAIGGGLLYLWKGKDNKSETDRCSKSTQKSEMPRNNQSETDFDNYRSTQMSGMYRNGQSDTCFENRGSPQMSVMPWNTQSNTYIENSRSTQMSWMPWNSQSTAYVSQVSSTQMIRY